MPSFRPISIRRAATAALAGAMILSILPAATMAAGPEPPASIMSAERAVLKYMNSFRASHGLVPLRMASRVRQVARTRSRSMKNQGYFAHTSPSGVNAARLLDSRNIRWSRWGENIGWTKYMDLDKGAQWMVDWWKQSSSHRHLMLSRSFNYAGIGIAKDGPKILYTIVFVNQPDHTSPRAGMVSEQRSISVSSVKDVTVRWWGKDRRLAVRTAGLKGFTVQQKRIGGNWRTILKHTKKRQITKDLRVGDYKFRVRSIDNRGNRSEWKRIAVHVR